MNDNTSKGLFSLPANSNLSVTHDATAAAADKKKSRPILHMFSGVSGTDAHKK